MGTRSVIHFYRDAEYICSVYQQYDGYHDGVGQELKDFIRSKLFVNGLGTGDDKRVFNGPGCFVAQFIAKYKTEAGGLYMTTKNDKEEYTYTVNTIRRGFGGVEVSCIPQFEFDEEEPTKSYNEIIPNKEE